MLRHALLARGPVDDVFLQSDDDYRPLKPIGAELFATDGRIVPYACYDLAQLPAQREQLRPRPAHQLPGAVLPRRRHPVLRLAHAAGARQGADARGLRGRREAHRRHRVRRVVAAAQLRPAAGPRAVRRAAHLPDDVLAALPARVAVLAPPRGRVLRELLPRALREGAVVRRHLHRARPGITRAAGVREARPLALLRPRGRASCASPRASTTPGRPAPAVGCSSGRPEGPASSTSTPPSRSAPSSPSWPERSSGWSDDRPDGRRYRHDRRHRDVERRAPAARLPRRGRSPRAHRCSSSTTPRPTGPRSCSARTTRRYGWSGCRPTPGSPGESPTRSSS